MSLDLLIRNATVVDGSGGPRYKSDVGVKDGFIVQLGRVRDSAERTIDADGLILSPGFIDGHTHYDAQINWDPMNSSTCWHGVTTVVMGNCGHAIAPCRPDQRDWVARCLSKVEDIPVEAMEAGIEWTWESFPEYLDTIQRLPKGMNHGVYLGHDSLRMYVMGERAFEKGAATESDIDQMRQLVKEAVLAGGLGLSISRTDQHTTPAGIPTASYFAEWSEIESLVSVLTELNAGSLATNSDASGLEPYRKHLRRCKQLAIDSGRPIVSQVLAHPYLPPYQEHLQIMDETAAAGGLMYGQAATQPFNDAFSLKSYLPFDVLPNWKEIRSLPIDEQIKRFGDPDVRSKLIADEASMRPRGAEVQGGGNAILNPMKPDYNEFFVVQDVATLNHPTVAEFAQKSGKHPVEVMLDQMSENPDQLFIQTSSNRKPEEIIAILKHPRTVTTFTDAAAHVSQTFGSPQHTLMLSYWVRDKQAFTLEEAVRKMTFDVATVWDFVDRGLIHRGYAADLILFDEATVKPLMPKVEYDLPGGARRLVQKAEGIHYTIVNGEVTLENGVSTGRYPGQLLKGYCAH